MLLLLLDVSGKSPVWASCRQEPLYTCGFFHPNYKLSLVPPMALEPSLHCLEGDSTLRLPFCVFWSTLQVSLIPKTNPFVPGS